jgi:hypothetical protein
MSNDFTPLIKNNGLPGKTCDGCRCTDDQKKKIKKNNGLPGKTCDRCRCTDDQYRDKHEEQIKLYRDQ